MQSTEHLDNLDTIKFTTLYLEPISNYTNAAAGPKEYTKDIKKNAKQCSDESLNKEIFDYNLNQLNQTKIF